MRWVLSGRGQVFHQLRERAILAQRIRVVTKVAQDLQQTLLSRRALLGLGGHSREQARGGRAQQPLADGDLPPANRYEFSLARRNFGDGHFSNEQLVAALPREMTAGLDTREFGDILMRYRDQLYPDSVSIDLDAARRVAQSLIAGGLIKPDANISGLQLTTL